MNTTDTILDTIVAAKQVAVERQKQQASTSQLLETIAALQPFEGVDFFTALKAESPSPKIIAEIKQASPSAGVLRQPFEPAEINQAYQADEHIVALSVLTENEHFKGSDDVLRYVAAHNIHHKPLLRKDFIFDPYQILEAKALGAQAYLLITSLFNEAELQALVAYGQSIGLEPLVEVHTADELAMAQTTSARCIGVNSRDLRNFAVDSDTHELLGRLDERYARIAESGVASTEDLARLDGVADAVLIGSYFMKAPDIPQAIHNLLGDGAQP